MTNKLTTEKLSTIYIQVSDIQYESSIATIRLLLENLEPDFSEDHLNSLIEVIAWNGCCTNKKDFKYLSKVMKKSEKKIENYFHQKNLKEMAKSRKTMI
jgi:hypothetical protein